MSAGITLLDSLRGALGAGGLRGRRLIDPTRPLAGIVLGGILGLAASRVYTGSGERTLLLLALGAAFIAGAAWPERAAPIALVWSLVQGAMRKWFFRDLQDLLFFAAVPLLAGAYVGLAVRRLADGRGLIPAPIAPPILSALVVWEVAEAFNPFVPDPRVALLGGVVRLFYIPLAYLVLEWARTKEVLLRGVRAFLLLSAPLLLLGFFQFSSPHDSALNQYTWGGSSFKAAGGGAVRVTSTFAYIWGYTAFLHVEVLLLLAVLAAPATTAGVRWIATALLGTAYVNLLMTGTRGAVLFVTASILAFGAALALREPVNRLAARLDGLRRTAIAVAVGAVLVAATPPGQAAAEAFWTRLTRASDSTAGRVSSSVDALSYLPRAGLTGFGLGTTYQGARRLVQDPAAWREIPRGFEEEPERMLIELGLAGYLLLYAVRFAIAWRAWRLFRSARDPDLRPLALALAVYMLPSALHLEVHADNLDRELFTWALVGVGLAVARLEATAPAEEAA